MKRTKPDTAAVGPSRRRVPRRQGRLEQVARGWFVLEQRGGDFDALPPSTRRLWLRRTALVLRSIRAVDKARLIAALRAPGVMPAGVAVG